MSQDIRNKIIETNVPKLIKSLLGSEIKEDSSIFQSCDSYIWNQIKFNRYQSVNSHEVRRKIETVCRRFEVESFPEYAAHVKELCNILINDPICTKHYELDVQFSVIEFLIELADQPIQVIRRHRNEKDAERRKVLEKLAAADDETLQKQKEINILKDLMAELAEDMKDTLIDVRIESDTDSLSDLSDDIKSDTEPETTDSDTSATQINIKNIENAIKSAENTLQPPKKTTQFEKYKSKKSDLNNLQGNWWQTNEHLIAKIESKSVIANFATEYPRYLNKISNNIIHFEIPSTVTEHCLLREIIMLFMKPVDCKFFEIKNNRITLRANVTIPSVTVFTLRTFLNDVIMEPLNMMYEIKNVIQMYKSKTLVQPNTLICFTAALEELLKPIKEQLIAYEERLLQQKPNQLNTLLSFELFMRDAFVKLKKLHSVVRQTHLPQHEQLPAYVKSIYLLAKLDNYTSNYENDITAAALLLATSKVYCDVLEAWWRTGCLHDWQNEFIIKIESNALEQNTAVLRELNDENVTEEIKQTIEKSRFYKMLRSHVLDFGETQRFLTEMNQIAEMLDSCADKTRPLYDELLDEVVYNERFFDIETETETKKEESKNTAASGGASFLLMLNDMPIDRYLFNAFKLNIDRMKNSSTAAVKICNRKSDVQHILHTLCNNCDLLPLHYIFNIAMERILTQRIDLCNEYVLQLFHKKLAIGAHVKYIRDVILLQANAFMYLFYDVLFQKIESGKGWANNALLSMQLDDVLSAYFPEKPAIIRIEINSKVVARTAKVSEAANEIFMSYETNLLLERVITPENMKDYNKIFCLLLKVKWAVWKLQQFRFVKKRNSDPYAPLSPIKLIMRRLEQLRFWLIYVIEGVHFHLCTNVLLALGQQFEKAQDLCRNLGELKLMHQSYLNTMCEHCLVTEHFDSFRSALDQLFHLIEVTYMEWQSCVSFMEDSHAMCLDIEESGSSNNFTIHEYLIYNDVENIEQMYIRCHQLLAAALKQEVNKNENRFLTGLEATFNYSLPY